MPDAFFLWFAFFPRMSCTHGLSTRQGLGVDPNLSSEKIVPHDGLSAATSADAPDETVSNARSSRFCRRPGHRTN